MTINLPADLEQFVIEKVGSGEYPSANDVVCEGLLLLRQREAGQKKLEELRHQVAVGIHEDDQGKVAPFDPQETLRRIRAKKTAGDD